MTLPRHYTVREVAEHLGMCQRHVERQIEQGRLTAYRFGKRKGLRVSESDLADYIRRSEVEKPRGAKLEAVR